MAGSRKVGNLSRSSLAVSRVTLLLLLCPTLHLSVQTSLPSSISDSPAFGKGQMTFSLVSLKTCLTLFLGDVGFLHLTPKWTLSVAVCTASCPQGQSASAFPFHKNSIAFSCSWRRVYVILSHVFILYILAKILVCCLFETGFAT